MGNVKVTKKSKTIITTHLNADFDAIASMLAAQKLYPDSLVVFPRSQEKKSKDFIINSMVYLLNMAEVTEIDFTAVKKLILVDTSQKSRIGKLAELLDNPGIEIHIYDHHPPAEDDIKADYKLYEPAGATVTILTKIIQERKIDISPDEATVLCLGIYEDTGSFTFTSTTEKDFIAAAFLLSRGASLSTISNLISREINPQQIGILNDMIQGRALHKVKGIDIVITSISTENYVPDLAFLVHKMLKMENIDVIFAIARMGNKVYIVARSNLSEVNVAAIIKSLGGGGHPFAAAAAIKDKTLVQVEQQLIKTLYSNIKATHQVKKNDVSASNNDISGSFL